MGLNILESVPIAERHPVASAVVTIFKDAFGPTGIMARSEDLLRNAVTALLDIPESTLLWIPRWLVDTDFRTRLLPRATDPIVRLYWAKEYVAYSAATRIEYTSAPMNKLRAYLTAPPLRFVFGQWKPKLDLRYLMDHRRILICDLSQGRLGADKAALLGKLLVAKLVLTAFARIDVPEDQRVDFPIILDEIQVMSSPILSKALSELRKFHTPLVAAHQYLSQLPAEVRESLKGNAGTILTLRIGADDAAELENEFFPELTRHDLVDLGPFQAWVCVDVDGLMSRPFTCRTRPWPHAGADERRREAILKASRERYGRPRTVVERWIQGWYAEQERPQPAKEKRRGQRRVSAVSAP